MCFEIFVVKNMKRSVVIGSGRVKKVGTFSIFPRNILVYDF